VTDFGESWVVGRVSQNLEDSAEVTIRCSVEFVGETATGDGKPWRGNVSGAPNTWFEFSPFASTTNTIITGRKREDIGSFTYTDLGNDAELCFDLDSPWLLADVGGNVRSSR
jgi:hypothetical protein